MIQRRWLGLVPMLKQNPHNAHLALMMSTATMPKTTASRAKIIQRVFVILLASAETSVRGLKGWDRSSWRSAACFVRDFSSLIDASRSMHFGSVAHFSTCSCDAQKRTESQDSL